LSGEDVLPAIWAYFSIPNFWLWVYLIFSISNAMLPSESDRQAWWSLFLYCIVALVVLFGLGIVEQITSGISGWLLSTLNHLSFAFLVTIVVDGAVIVAVFALESVVMVITGRKVEY